MAKAFRFLLHRFCVFLQLPDVRLRFLFGILYDGICVVQFIAKQCQLQLVRKTQISFLRKLAEQGGDGM